MSNILSKSPAEHARLAPSSSSRWLNCPGSAQHDLPDSSSPQSEAGTIAHDLTQLWLDDPGLALLPVLEADIYEGVVDLLGEDNAWGVAEASADYAEHVYNLDGRTYTENKVFHDTIPDFFGTIDCVNTGETGQLTIVDLKTGTYKVPARHNTQLMCYALLARQEWGFYGTEDVDAVIVQSRVYKKPQKTTFTKQVLDNFAKEVAEAGQQTDTYKAGSWCKFCPLKPDCVAYQKKYGD